MSKAFTKDDDGLPEDELPDEPAPLPAGTKNYMTPRCAERHRAELKNLLDVERPKTVETVAWAASLGDRSENADYIYGKRRLREIDRRMRFLTKRLESAEIIDPALQKSDRVVFGATVDVHDENGTLKTFRIIGVDEIDAKRLHISWVSPVGRALLKAKVGDFVSVRTPSGDEELEIVAIRYEPIPD